MKYNKAVIIYGPPGAGKGTQAELLSRIHNFIHFDTGRYLERELFYSSDFKPNVLKKERKLFKEGKLCTPSFVLDLVVKETKKLWEAKADVVYSGSPRTLYEAFGDDKKEGLIAVLNKLFGKENVFVILLDVPEKVSLHRNSNRKICTVCGLQMLAGFKQNRCSLCYGKLGRRVALDNISIIKKRLIEYENRTKPIINELKKRKFKKLFVVDGTPPPFKVYEKIAQIIKIKK